MATSEKLTVKDDIYSFWPRELETNPVFRALQRSSLVCVFDSHGHVIFLNERFLQRCGYTQEELVGYSTDDHPCHLWKLHWQSVVEHGRWSGDASGRAKDGTRYWLDTQISSIAGPHENIIGYIAVSNDITGRKILEERVADLEKKLLAHGQQVEEKLLDRFDKISWHLPGFIYQYKLRPDGTSCFPYASRGISEIYDVQPEDVEQDAGPVFKVIHPDDLPHVADSIAVSAKTLTRWRDQYRVVLPGRGEVWVEGTSSPQRLEDGSIVWHGYISDITARKKSEMALKESQSVLATLVGNLPGFVYRVTRDYHTIYISEQVESITGYSQSDYLTDHIIECGREIHPEDDKWIAEATERAIQEKSSFEYEYRIISKGGAVKWVWEKGMPVFDDAGNLQYLEGFITDITERKKIEDTNQKLALIAQLSDNLVSITDASGTIEWVNESFLSMTGYQYEEVKGKLLAEILFDDPKRALPDKSQRFEVFGLHKLTHGLWLDVDIQPVLRNDGVLTNYIAVALDITHRKQSEILLRKFTLEVSLSNEMLTSISENIPQGAIYQLMIHDDGRRQFNYMSSGITRLLGLDVEDVLNDSEVLYRLHHPDDVAELIRRETESFSELKIFDAEFRVFTVRGEMLWLHVRSQPRRTDGGVLFQGFVENVTERKEIEQRLREATERFQMASSLAGVGVYEWKVSSGQVVWDGQMFAMYGIPEGTPVDFQLFRSCVHPEDIGQVERNIAEMIAQKKQTSQFPFRIVNKQSGDVRQVFMYAKNEYDSEGNLVRQIGANYDATEIREKEERIVIQNQQLELANQRFRMAVNAAGFGVLEFDWVSRDVYMDERLRELMGFDASKESELMKSWMRFIAEEDVKTLQQSIGEVMYGGGTKRVVFRWNFGHQRARVMEGYGIRDINSKGHPMLVCAIWDITEKQTALDLLAESESRFKLAAQMGKLGVYEWIIADEEAFFDPIAVSIFKLETVEPAQWLSVWIKGIHPEDRPLIDEAVRRVIKDKEPQELTYRWRTLNGEELIIQVSAIAKVDADSKPVGLMGIAQDITERRRAEDRLRESEERFRNMADSAPAYVWLCDQDHRVSFFSKGWYDFRGTTTEEELGSGWLDGVHPDDVARVAAHCEERFSTRSPIDMEYRLRRHDGVYRWILDTGVPRFLDDGEFIGYIGSCIDITDRVEAEYDLRFTRFTVENSSDPIFWINPDASFRDFNTAAYRSLGYTREEMQSMKVGDIDVGYSEAVWGDHWKELREKRSMKFNSKQRRKDGTLCDVEINANLVLFAGHEFNIAFVRDITERLRIEKEREENSVQLEQALREKDVLLKEIHHRIKNNLQLISSIIYIRMCSMDRNDVFHFLEETRQKIRSIALMHERLLQTESIHEVDAREYILKLIEDMKATSFDRNSKIHIIEHIEPHTLDLDTAINLGLILNELVTNAMKYAFADKESGLIEITLHKKGEGFEFRVADNGVGLPAHVQPGRSGTFGMQMLEIFTKQIHAAITIHRENGTAYHITFPHGG